MTGKSVQNADADVFTAIAHPARRQILDYLREDGSTVKALASRFEISRPAISQHLAILLETGLVSKHPEGRENHYQLQPEALAEIDAWLRHYRRFWESKLDSLGDYLDSMEDNNAP